MRIWGRNMVHLLPIIVPDHMVLQEFSFQTIIDGVFPKFTKHKKNACPKFPLSLDSLVLQNSTHAAMQGKEITIMHLGEAPKRMHDPKSYLENSLHMSVPGLSMFMKMSPMILSLEQLWIFNRK